MFVRDRGGRLIRQAGWYRRRISSCPCRCRDKRFFIFITIERSKQNGTGTVQNLFIRKRAAEAVVQSAGRHEGKPCALSESRNAPAGPWKS
jgi:hypothetical protein